MSTTQQPPKQKATVDDIVQQLAWLNENFASFAKRHDQHLATMQAREAFKKKHLTIERAVQGVLCGCIFLFAIAAASNQAVSGNLAQLMAENVVETKTIVPSLVAAMAAIGVWRAIKTQP